MRVYDAEYLHFRDAPPIKPAVRLAGNLGVVGRQQQAARMPHIHRNLPGPVAGQFVGTNLRQKPQSLQIVRRHQVSQSLANAPAIVRPVFAHDGLLVRQFLGELRVGEGQFHASP